MNVNVTFADRKAVPRMLAFLKTLGISEPTLNVMLSALNQRPIYDAPNATEALSSITAALPGCRHLCVKDAGIELHSFVVPGCGTVRMRMNRMHPKHPTPITMTSFFKPVASGI
jgi:hypothetical protein